MTSRRTIYIDTTEFFDRYLLNQRDWQELLERAGRGQVTLAVPEVVLQEARRQYAERLDKAVADWKRHQRALGQLGFEQIEPDLQLQRDRLASSYRNVVERLILASGGEVLPLPQASHQDVLDRVISRRKPFNENGKGYQDTLIWLTVVQHLAKQLEVPTAEPLDAEFILVTGNSRDFCDQSGGLDEELVSEVAQAAPGMVLGLITGIRDLIEELRLDYEVEDREHRLAMLYVAIDRTDVEDEFRSRAADLEAAISGAVESRADELLGRAVTNMASTEPMGFAIADSLPDEFTDVTVDSVEVDPLSLEFQAHDSYEGDTFAVAAAIDADLVLEGFVERDGFRAVDDGRFDVLDPDWGDGVMLVALRCTVRLTFNLIVIGADVEDAVLENAEIV